MKSKYIPALVMLLAGAIVGIFTIIKKFEVLYSLKILLIALIAFYIMGLIAQKIVISIEKQQLASIAEENEDSEEDDFFDNKDEEDMNRNE